MRRSALLALLVLVAAVPRLHGGDAQPAPAADAETLRLYDLSDLQTPPRDFPALALLRGQLALGGGVFEPGAEKPAPALDDVLRAHFEPAMADLLRPRSALRDGRLLIVTAGPALHRHVETALAAARRRQTLQVTTRIAFYTMPPQQRQTRFALPGLRWRALAGHPGMAIADLTPAEQAGLVGSLRGDQVAQHACPSITSFAGQLASAGFDIGQFGYLSPVFTAKGPELKTTTLSLGEGTEVRATPTADNTFIHLELTRVRVVLLETVPIPWEGRDDAKGGPVVPVTATATIRIDQAIANGHGVVVATDSFLLAKDEPRAGFLIVDCTIQDDAARERQTKTLQERKAELKAALQRDAEARTPEPPKDPDKAAPPAIKGADNF